MNEFPYYLYDTLILLGCRKDIADRILMLDLLDESDVDALRQYNIDLLDATKDRLVNINTIEIRVAADSES